MTLQRAIEILNPEHREHYDGIETVNEACRMGMEALKIQLPQKPKSKPDEYGGTWFLCPKCSTQLGSLENRGLASIKRHCFWCGQAIDWKEDDES